MVEPRRSMDIAGPIVEDSRSMENRESDGAGEVFTGTDYSALLEELEVGWMERCVFF